MRFLLSVLAIFASLSTAMAAPAPKAAAKANRLFCRTGLESRPNSQSLDLNFQYLMPVMYEPEDPTMPFGRQVVVLSGRPLVQLNYRRASEAAGENGEKLEPMTCAFAKRTVAPHEPNHVQIFLPTGQTHWLGQAIGQRPGPKQLSFERAIMNPAGDWSFASLFNQVFFVDLDDTKNFVTTQLPKAL
jgi:hypothetical protein